MKKDDFNEHMEAIKYTKAQEEEYKNTIKNILEGCDQSLIDSYYSNKINLDSILKAQQSILLKQILEKLTQQTNLIKKISKNN